VWLCGTLGAKSRCLFEGVGVAGIARWSVGCFEKTKVLSAFMLTRIFLCFYDVASDLLRSPVGSSFIQESGSRDDHRSLSTYTFL
jgi:hypothetical protein